MTADRGRRLIESGVGALDIALNLTVAAIALAVLVGALGGPYWLALDYGRGGHPAGATVFALVWTTTAAWFVVRIRKSPGARGPWVWSFIAVGFGFVLAGRALT